MLCLKNLYFARKSGANILRSPCSFHHKRGVPGVGGHRLRSLEVETFRSHVEHLVHPKLIAMRRERFEERIDEILRPLSIHTFRFVWKVLLTDDESKESKECHPGTRRQALCKQEGDEMYLSLSMSKHRLPQTITCSGSETNKKLSHAQMTLSYSLWTNNLSFATDLQHWDTMVRRSFVLHVTKALLFLVLHRHPRPSQNRHAYAFCFVTFAAVSPRLLRRRRNGSR